jgi:hypothetical protein
MLLKFKVLSRLIQKRLYGLYCMRSTDRPPENVGNIHFMFGERIGASQTVRKTVFLAEFFIKQEERQKIGRFQASRPLKNDGSRRIFVLSSKEF